ncbi:MAG TPA: type II secretion system F family protein, partial [Ilumatobacteraceae bacterium]
TAMIAGLATLVILVLVAWRLTPRPAVRGTATASPVARRTRICVLVVVVTALLATLVSPVLATVVVGVALLSQRWSKARRRSCARRQVASDFPDALDLLVLSIRAGYLPAQAVVEIGPFLTLTVRDAFESVATRMSKGMRFADALTCLSAELGPIAQPLVDSLSAADRYGLPLAPVLERLSLEARQQRRRDSDAAARELPVRLAVPLVLCTLPSFVLLAIVPLLLGALSSLHT